MSATRPGWFVLRIRRRFQRLTCPGCGRQVRGRFEEKQRRWRHLAVWSQDVVLDGRSSEELQRFFRELGSEACQRIELVTMDMSAAYEKAVRECLPHAEIAFDHFHVARLGNEALNEVRRGAMRPFEGDPPAQPSRLRASTAPIPSAPPSTCAAAGSSFHRYTLFRRTA